MISDETSPSVVHVANFTKVPDKDCRKLLAPVLPNGKQLTERYN